jgi:hypothetical protein
VVPGIADNTDPNSLASRLRRERMRYFIELLESYSEPVRVLDVGGTPSFWQRNAPDLPKVVHLTLLNLTRTPTGDLANAVSVAGDARDLRQFADRSFDICFSNSVIEHVGTLEDQRAMAREVQRVAKSFFIQTPNRWFPIEPHFLFPGWQFLPVSVRAALHRRFRLGWMPPQPDPALARREVEEIRLLTAGEMQSLFPGASIRREKIGPFTKSLMAIRR